MWLTGLKAPTNLQISLPKIRQRFFLETLSLQEFDASNFYLLQSFPCQRPTKSLSFKPSSCQRSCIVCAIVFQVFKEGLRLTRNVLLSPSTPHPYSPITLQHVRVQGKNRHSGRTSLDVVQTNVNH